MVTGKKGEIKKQDLGIVVGDVISELEDIRHRFLCHLCVVLDID